MRTVERRWCYWQVISIHVFCPCHQQEIKLLDNSKCLELLRPKKEDWVAWIRVRKGGWWLGDSGNARKKTKLSLHIFPKGSRKILLCRFRWQRGGMLFLVGYCWWELNYQTIMIICTTICISFTMMIAMMTVTMMMLTNQKCTGRPVREFLERATIRPWCNPFATVIMAFIVISVLIVISLIIVIIVVSIRAFSVRGRGECKRLRGHPLQARGSTIFLSYIFS